jgi:hypothetical protein
MRETGDVGISQLRWYIGGHYCGGYGVGES